MNRLPITALRWISGCAISVVLLLQACGAWNIPWLQQMESTLYDLRVRTTLTNEPDPRIVILDIDEKSLAHPQLGRWPWGRDRLATLMDIVFNDYHMAAVGFDVVHAEADHSDGLLALEEFAKHSPQHQAAIDQALTSYRPTGSNDAQFQAALHKYPMVLGYYFTQRTTTPPSGTLPAPLMAAPAGLDLRPQWSSYGANLAQFQDTKQAAGHFQALLDPDGVVRRAWVLSNYQAHYFESLSLALVRVLTGSAPVELQLGKRLLHDEPVLQSLSLAGMQVPLMPDGSAWIPFRGTAGSYRYISLADVLDKKVDPKALEGLIGIVGSSTSGLLDLRSTPVGEVYPGVEIHANMISGMMDGTIPQPLPQAPWIEILGIVCMLLLGNLVLPRLGPLHSVTLLVIVLSTLFGTGFWLWSHGRWIVPLASTSLALALPTLTHLWFNYLSAARIQLQMQDLFGQYVPPELVQKMAQNPSHYSMEGRAAELTVLFSDIRGFTSISEKLSARELALLINEYLTEMSSVIRANGGTLDKYIGDAIMTFWGAPVADSHHAQHALDSARSMIQALPALNQRFEAKGWPRLAFGVGINTGAMTVGDMGSNVRRSYTVMGDSVNLASRLESLTKHYGVALLIGEATQRALPNVPLLEVDRVKVKGKDQAITIYTDFLAPVVFSAHSADHQRWNQALQEFRSQQWDAAAESFTYFLQNFDGLSMAQLYLDRIAQCRTAQQAADWDGVVSFDH